MARTFTLGEARAMVPRLHAVADQLIPTRARLAALVAARNRGEDVAVTDLKALEARITDLLDTLAAEGVQIKGYAPLLVDLPHRHGGRTVLLCWLEGEGDLAWYHELDHGFMGRRPLSDLAGAAGE